MIIPLHILLKLFWKIIGFEIFQYFEVGFLSFLPTIVCFVYIILFIISSCLFSVSIIQYFILYVVFNYDKLVDNYCFEYFNLIEMERQIYADSIVVKSKKYQENLRH